MSTKYNCVRKFLEGFPLTDVDFTEIVEIAKNCANGKGSCPRHCPIAVYKEVCEYTPCAEFFAKFIYDNAFKFGGNPDSKTQLNELADKVTKICNEIKAKTKRETPMQVVVSHSNGKTLYKCYNCGKPLFIQPSTQYCECCGQKLSFEVVENEI